MSIIKRKKQDKYFVMSNHAPQQALISLSSIGLLAYITSLPHDFKLYKTYLQKKFTRRSVDNAWSELVNKNYIAGFSCYVDRKKAYYYLASDETLTQEEFDEFVADTIDEIKEDGFEPKNLQPIKDCNLTVAQNVQHCPASDVQSVQYKEYSTQSAVPDVQIQSKDKQVNKNKVNNNKINSVNKEAIHDLFLKSSQGLFKKQEIEYLTNQIISEVTIEPTNPLAYFSGVIDNIVARKRVKENASAVPFYNWLEE